MTPRRFLTAAATALVAALLAGCTTHSRFGNDPPLVYPTDHNKEPVVTRGKYGGSMSGAFLSDPKTFNIIVADDADSAGLAGVFYDVLAGRDAFTLKYIPRLADLPKISPDGLTYTFTLRPNLKWSDGQPLTIDDVVFTLDVIYDPNIQCQFRENEMIDVPQPDGTTKPTPFKYEKIDDRTIRFTLPARWAPALDLFSVPIIPKHVMEPVYKAGKFNSSWGIDTPPSAFVGCGPYLMDSYAPGQRIILKPNPYFWRTQFDQKLPYLDSFQYLIVPDTNAMTLNFRAGGSDTLPIPALQYPSIARYAKRDNYTVVDRGPDWGFGYLCFNMNPNSTMDKTLLSLFQDKRFRQACSYAIDRQGICNNILLGLAHPLYAPVTPADTQYFDPKVKQYPYDPARARKMLLDMGLTDDGTGMLLYKGKRVTFNIITNTENQARKSISTILSSNLRAIGLDAKFTPISFNDLIRRVNAPPYDWQVTYLGFTGGPEPNSGATIWRSNGPQHQWWPRQKKPVTDWEARIDRDFAQGARELDPAKRKKYYDDWQEIIGEQQPMIFTTYGEDYTAVRNHFGNIKPTPSYGLGGDVYWNLEEVYDTHAVRITR